MSAKPAAKTANIYSISSNHFCAIESELSSLLESARKGEISGLSYVVCDRKDKLVVGRAGSHFADADKAIASLFRSAVALATVA